MSHVILMSNLGYLRGFTGCLKQHVRYAHRHIYCPPGVQEACLRQVLGLIEQERPDLCCFVEIDRETARLPAFSQLTQIAGRRYPFFDIENKYGPASRLRQLPWLRGKSNGFLSTRELPYEKIFFSHGVKRLIYRIELEPQLTLFFAHFSLKKRVRAMQLAQVGELLRQTPGEVIVLGDFNIHSGFGELAPLLEGGRLVLLNREEEPTFRFHKLLLPLDLCLCSPGIAARAQLKIVPQPYSDHEALLLTLGAP